MTLRVLVQEGIYSQTLYPRKSRKSQMNLPVGNDARRWVVERTHSWLNRYRKFLVRFEKTTAGYEGLLELACALIIYRPVITIYG